MILDHDKILDEVELFFRFRGDLIDPEKMHLIIGRVERYLNALDLIKKYSFQSETARTEHKLKFEVSEQTVMKDFYIAWHILGKEGMWNKEVVRNWMINKLMKWIEQAEKDQNHDAKAKYSKLLYEYRDLDKDTSDLPDLSEFEFKEPRIMANPKAVELKNNPKALEDKIKVWNKPKKSNKLTDIQEAEIIPDND